MRASTLFIWILSVGLAHGQTEPVQVWEYNDFTWQLYSGPKKWQQAESWCSDIGEGWHLASLTTPQEFENTKKQLQAASINRDIYKSSSVNPLSGCGKEGNTYDLVWTGLHDPSNADAKGATWQQVAATFTWSDDRTSPYLTKNAQDYFSGRESEQESCIGLKICTIGTEKDPDMFLTKHPCDWKMSFLCKGPASKATAYPEESGAARAPNPSPARAAPPTPPAPPAPPTPPAPPSGCQAGTTCAAVVGPVVGAVGAIIAGLLAYLGARRSRRSEQAQAPTPPSADRQAHTPSLSTGVAHTITVPSYHVNGGGR